MRRLRQINMHPNLEWQTLQTMIESAIKRKLGGATREDMALGRQVCMRIKLRA